jgi:hypothetical protein
VLEKQPTGAAGGDFGDKKWKNKNWTLATKQWKFLTSIKATLHWR